MQATIKETLQWRPGYSSSVAANRSGAAAANKTLALIFTYIHPYITPLAQQACKRE